MSDRYDGKPLLRLLELYVLKALGELPALEEETLAKLAPKLQTIYGGDGTWDGAIETAVRMPKDMPGQIRDLWAQNLQIAQAKNVPALSAQQFAELFVDENLTT